MVWHKGCIVLLEYHLLGRTPRLVNWSQLLCCGASPGLVKHCFLLACIWYAFNIFFFLILSAGSSTIRKYNIRNSVFSKTSWKCREYIIYSHLQRSLSLSGMAVTFVIKHIVELIYSHQTLCQNAHIYTYVHVLFLTYNKKPKVWQLLINSHTDLLCINCVYTCISYTRYCSLATSKYCCKIVLNSSAMQTCFPARASDITSSVLVSIHLIYF